MNYNISGIKNYIIEKGPMRISNNEVKTINHYQKLYVMNCMLKGDGWFTEKYENP